MKKIIQIAGVIDLPEAQMLIEQGVEYLGFPLRLKDGREDLSEDSAREIINQIKTKSKPVLITYLDNADEISAFSDSLNLDIVQLHGELDLVEIKKLKALWPNLKIIKSLIVKEDNLGELQTQIKRFSPYVDIFITDTFDRQTGRSGATGKTHCWDISREVVKIAPKPVILAGGLNAENVRDAIKSVKPAGVDSHTGVEDEYGRKNLQKVNKFVSEVEKGFNDLLNGY